MYCINCGGQIADNAKFCAKCGNMVVQQQDFTQTPQAQQSVFVQTPQDQQMGAPVYVVQPARTSGAYKTATRILTFLLCFFSVFPMIGAALKAASSSKYDSSNYFDFYYDGDVVHIVRGKEVSITEDGYQYAYGKASGAINGSKAASTIMDTVLGLVFVISLIVTFLPNKHLNKSTIIFIIGLIAALISLAFALPTMLNNLGGIIGNYEVGYHVTYFNGGKTMMIVGMIGLLLSSVIGIIVRGADKKSQQQNGNVSVQ